MSVRSFPVFYGWVIAAIGTLGLVASSPGQTYVISILLDPLLKEFKLSRTSFSSLYLVATLSGSFLLPKVGKAIDRFGSRLIFSTISIALGLVLLGGSFIKNIEGLALLLIGLRFLGQGSLTLVSVTMINQWWLKKRGRLMGIVGLLSAILGTGCFPLLVHWGIVRWGWRGTLRFEAFLLFAILCPLVMLAARHRPEDHGLLPDGEKAETKSKHLAELPEIEGQTRSEALASPLFWLAGSGIALQAMLITGLHFHAVGLFKDHGLDAATAAATYLPIAATAAGVTFLSGWWVERVSVLKLLAASLLLVGTSLASATKLGTTIPVLAYAVMLGSTGGLFRTVSGVIWSQLFGRKALGAITGLATTMMVAGSAFGPLPMGWARDQWGSFDDVLLLLSVFPCLLAALTLWMDFKKQKCKNMP